MPDGNAAKAPSAMADERASFHNLDRMGRLTAGIALRPRWVVNLAIAGAVLIAWTTLLAVGTGAAQRRLSVGPGDALLRFLPELPFPAWLADFASLCLAPADAAGGFGALWLMWMLMALAMMLPSAVPMIRTYCEIADTAAAKGEDFSHPLVLVAGYLAVWAVASLAFAALTLVAVRLDGSPGLFLPPVALAAAGAYQFSGLKEACLRKCRNPFAILFARWSTRPLRIFRLGVEQGVWCLGCCWALMLVMFAVGIMNVFWMALIGLFAIVEKQWEGRLVSRLAGTILLVWAAALLVVSS